MKDSLGNELPKKINLPANASEIATLRSLITNTFLLAAKSALKHGATVIYNKETKSATITDNGELISTIKHA